MQQMPVCSVEEQEKEGLKVCVSHLFGQGPPGPLVCQGTRQKSREEGGIEEKRVWVGLVR